MKTVIVFLLFIAYSSFGQTVRVFNYHPTGNFGVVMKPLTSVEIGSQTRFSKRSTKNNRWGFSFLYLNMKPRADSFPTTKLAYDVHGRKYEPTVHYFSKYALFQTTMGYDYAFVHKERLNVYAGLDLVVGVSTIALVEGYTNGMYEHYEGNSVLGGYRLRLGLDYTLTDMVAVSINVSKSGFAVGDPQAKLGANDIGLGLRFAFGEQVSD
jgi:hypothetical protein